MNVYSQLVQNKSYNSRQETSSRYSSNTKSIIDEDKENQSLQFNSESKQSHEQYRYETFKNDDTFGNDNTISKDEKPNT